MIQSPLKYKGDDPRIVSLMNGIIPKDVKKICSPFLAGGSLELSLAHEGKKVFAYTSDEELLEFWQCLSEEPDRVVGLASAMRTDFYDVLFKDPMLYNAMRDSRRSPEDKYLRAALFFALNLTNSSRSVATGTRAADYKNKFSEVAMLKLRRASDNSVIFLKSREFCDIAKIHSNHLLYCRVPHIVPYPSFEDPEYEEQPGWNELKAALQDRDNWILFCNNHSRVRSEFAKDEFHFVDKNYKLTDDEKSKEIIIVRRT
tara:strand:- start:202 stop:975 length:774 start_codon:yes stop_codon:yes gene_type:complete